MNEKPDKSTKNKLVVPVVIVLGIPLICILLFLLIERPRYINLDIDAPNSQLSRGGWSKTERIVQTWSDSYSKFYILRKESGARSEEFSSWQEVADYFDAWLSSNGWVLHPSPLFTSCQTWLPEAAFLEPGEGGYLVYYRTEREMFDLAPLVCLAIVPYSYDGNVQGYDVIIITGNPSPYTQFLRDI